MLVFESEKNIPIYSLQRNVYTSKTRLILDQICPDLIKSETYLKKEEEIAWF